MNSSELINGKKTVCRPIANTTSGDWTSDGHILELVYNGGPGIYLTFTTTVSPNHMELQGSNGNNTIQQTIVPDHYGFRSNSY
jgi:hypothetical protein